jgi:hypothetical protein
MMITNKTALNNMIFLSTKTIIGLLSSLLILTIHHPDLLRFLKCQQTNHFVRSAQ